MSDVAGGVDAPAEASPAAVEPVAPPNPISVNNEAPEPKEGAKVDDKTEPAKPLSAREALQKARDKVDAEPVASKEAKLDNKAVEKPVAKAEPVKSDGPARSEDGKFAAKTADGEKTETVQQPAAKVEAGKPATPAADAPARFSTDAKAAWATAPEPVKAEVHRAIREMEAGIERYRGDADEFNKVREFAEVAKKNGGDLHTSLTKVVAIENAFSRNPIDGLQAVCDHFGLSLRGVAAHIMNQTPDQATASHEATIRSMRQEFQSQIAALKGEIGNVNRSMTERDLTTQISQFAADKPRFNELSDTIAKLIQTGMAKDHIEAYDMAERLQPAPQQQAATHAAQAAPDLTAQTLKGSKSVTGAPTPGSNPAARQASSSIKDALRRAAAAAG